MNSEKLIGVAEFKIRVYFRVDQTMRSVLIDISDSNFCVSDHLCRRVKFKVCTKTFFFSWHSTVK